MSHLKPNDPETGKSKDYKDYTPAEKASALTQMTDAAGTRIAQGKDIHPETAKLMKDFAKGTEKAETLDPAVEKAAAGDDKKK